MKKWCALIAIALLFNQGFALLSPLSQSAIELKTLISSPEIAKYIPESEWIMDIRRLESSFVIVTTSLRMVVDIDYLPSKRVGPQQFKLYFNPPEKLEKELLD